MSRLERFLAQPVPGSRLPRPHHGLRAKLGPMPGASLRAMDAYGLSDREIAHYYGLTPSTVRRLRRALMAHCVARPA
ncbi:hypothetical protein [Ostreiculturibacter nitratireducens]|uniref:hypothetical protein n=1 Tax=Ostreiculturibacter nitratireducens TaxID=3075226 RepID=UPI0031B59973